ncbi:MAG: glycosyltransferase [Clostridiaceae bacterium]|nr:glycosyltransferase [Clostridiaceae bacterium]
MIVKNEEKHIARCLDSVRGIVDEIIVVDTGSTDKTKELAMSYGASVYDFEWIDDFSAARNFSIEKSTGDWNLFLDADEYITNDCRDIIRRFINNNQAIGKIACTNYFYDGDELHKRISHISRLAPKSVFFEGRIHEQLCSDLPRINVDVQVSHDGYLKEGKSDRNLPILYSELESDPKNPYILYQIASTLFASKKHAEADQYFRAFYECAPILANYRYTGIVSYLYNIIALKKFEEGLQIIANEKDRLSGFPDFHFVCGIFYMELVLSDVGRYIKYLPLIEQEYLMCLEIGETDVFDSVVGTGSYCAAYNLAAYYEVSGNTAKALQYYEMSHKWGYEKASQRLAVLKPTIR